MEQGSLEWHKWRSSGIGASESAQILELSPYGSRLDLWYIKTGRKQPKDISFKMDEAGKAVESMLRAKHALHRGRDYRPVCAFHDEFPFMLASLDGYDENHGEGIEIKFIGKEKYENDFIAEHHHIQVQHQMLVLGAKEWEYLMSCDRGATYKAFTIKENKELQEKILVACTKFWNFFVKKDVQPPYGPNDYRPITDEATKDLVLKFKEAKLANSKKDVERLKLEIRPLLKYPKMEFEGVKISPSQFRLESA